MSLRKILIPSLNSLVFILTQQTSFLSSIPTLNGQLQTGDLPVPGVFYGVWLGQHLQPGTAQLDELPKGKVVMGNPRGKHIAGVHSAVLGCVTGLPVGIGKP